MHLIVHALVLRAAPCSSGVIALIDAQESLILTLMIEVAYVVAALDMSILQCPGNNEWCPTEGSGNLGVAVDGHGAAACR